MLSFGGFLGLGDKYFAIPWNKFEFHLAEKRVVLNVDKKLLEKATGFAKDNWPNLADSTWGRAFISTMVWPLTGKKSWLAADNGSSSPGAYLSDGPIVVVRFMD